jgi:phospholipid-binding lipoprotein MlaA
MSLRRLASFGPALFGLALLVAALVASGEALALLPHPIQNRIEAAARDARELARQEQVLSRTVGSRDLAAADQALSLRRNEAALSGAVILSIAENPALASEIVATAVAAAPEFRDSVVANASRAYPGFAPAISAAASGRYTPAPASASAPPPPAPVQQAQRPAPAPPVTMPRGTTEGQGARPAASGDDDGPYDPWERFNRGIFAFNDVLDTYLLKPIAQVYGFIMPNAAKDNVQNAFYNIREPVRLANDLLQFEGRDALKTTGRFLVNTTVGLVGLFDVADAWGMKRHPSDFGQTLHVYGAGAGPYLVLPIFGPSTLRDGTGTVVDLFFDPRTYLLDFPINLGITGAAGVVRRESLLEPLDDLRENSIDFYAALRSAYFQDRAGELRRGKPADTSDLDKMFDEMQ